MWRSKPASLRELTVWKLKTPEDIEPFSSKFDKVQEQLEILGNSDDLLAGMSSISIWLFHTQLFRYTKQISRTNTRITSCFVSLSFRRITGSSTRHSFQGSYCSCNKLCWGLLSADSIHSRSEWNIQRNRTHPSRYDVSACMHACCVCV